MTFKRIQYLSLLAYLTAAVITGIVIVLFMWAFDFAISKRLDFQSIGAWSWLVTPLVFVGLAEWIRRVAPFAAGTGIPQMVFAATNANASSEKKIIPLISFKTLAVKVVAVILAVAVGASTGREGPSVQVATCVFVSVLLAFRRLFGLRLDWRSVIVAGSAAGLAAAFNTPLAGVSFAIEELTPDFFSGIKDFVLMAIIVAAMSAQVLTGDYTYFGKVSDAASVPFWTVLAIGAIGGVCGAFFSTAILEGQRILSRWQNLPYARIAITAIASLGLLSVTFFAGIRVLGPGNQVAQGLLGGQFVAWIGWFPLAKMAATLFTYWSGIAGGIFAPALAIGAALGATLANWTGNPIPGCSLVGMAAFLAGTIQAPMTAFIIIFEMTDQHQLLLPVMLAALFAVVVARLLGAKHLYKSLAENYYSR